MTASPRAAWRYRPAEPLYASVLFAGLADWMASTALVVYVYQRTESPWWVAALWLARAIAWVALSGVGSQWAARAEARVHLLRLRWVSAAVMVLLAALTAVHGPVALALALAAVAQASSALQRPAALAAGARLVPEDQLSAAGAAVSFLEQLTFMTGSAFGALVVWLGSVPLALALDAAAFVLAAALVARLPRLPRSFAPLAAQHHVPLRAALADGSRAVARDHALFVVLGVEAAIYFLSGVEGVVHVLVSSQLLGTGTSGVGLLTASIGIGGALMAPFTSRLAVGPRVVRHLAIAAVVVSLPILGLAYVHVPLAAYVLVVVEGAAFVTCEVLVVTLLQRVATGARLMAATSLLTSLAAVAVIGGTVAAPPLVHRLGLTGTLVATSGVMLVVFLAVSPWLRRLDSESAAFWRDLGDRVAALAQLPLLAGLSEPSLERLAASASERRVAADVAIVRQGEPPEHLYLVREGRVAVRRHDTHTGDRLVAMLGAGEWFGEIGLVQSVPCTATVSTVEPAVLWRVPGEAFLEAIGQLPTMPDPLRLGLAARLRQTLQPAESGAA